MQVARAELYLTYDYRETWVRRYIHPDEPEWEIVLDIYDVSSSEEAFGIFTSEREDEDIGIGTDSEYGGGLMRFWKDRYFVSMVVLGDEGAARPVMFEIGRAVADAISQEGARPALLETLPEEGLREREIRYFHSMQVLNNHYYISSENILNLGRNTDCVFTEYRISGDTGFLLLIRYENMQQAHAGYEQFVEEYMPEGRESGYALMENGRWTSVRHSENLVVAVFDAPDTDWASQLISGISLEGK
ncbi:DUF6599 family protein [candidate division KSB1 bacterium]